MPLVLGAAVSHSPLLYRPRRQWPDIARFLTDGVVQPRTRDDETGPVLDDYEKRIKQAFDALADRIETGALDALIVLYADRDDMFDDSNVPQLHLQIGGEVWADAAVPGLSEPTRVQRFVCHRDAADLLGEELVKRGFDLSEGRDGFKPIGATGRGIGPAVGEAVERLGAGLPIIPLHVNCHAAPTLSGRRLLAVGRALGDAAALSPHRLGVLVTGGLSGDPGGPMSGWIDDVLDEWVLTRLVRDQADEIAGMWGAQSRTLAGNSADIRLWQVAAAALTQAGCRARVLDYAPIHHAAAGVGFVAWEQTA